MMLYPSINDLRTKVDSRYTLCILAAKRARDIIDGKPVLTEVESECPVSLATNEISEDRITFCRHEKAEWEDADDEATEEITADASEETNEAAEETAADTEDVVTADDEATAEASEDAPTAEDAADAADSAAPEEA